MPLTSSRYLGRALAVETLAGCWDSHFNHLLTSSEGSWVSNAIFKSHATRKAAYRSASLETQPLEGRKRLQSFQVSLSW